MGMNQGCETSIYMHRCRVSHPNAKKVIVPFDIFARGLDEEVSPSEGYTGCDRQNMDSTLSNGLTGKTLQKKHTVLVLGRKIPTYRISSTSPSGVWTGLHQGPQIPVLEGQNLAQFADFPADLNQLITGFSRGFFGGGICKLYWILELESTGLDNRKSIHNFLISLLKLFAWNAAPTVSY